MADRPVLGDPVNVASRLESLTKLAGVDNLVDGNTYEQVKHLCKAKRVRFEKIRGKIQEVKIYTITDIITAEASTRLRENEEVVVKPED